jgi:hypothetical protein
MILNLGSPALKGCDKISYHSFIRDIQRKEVLVPALQAGLSNHHKTQGFALGYVLPALQAEKEPSAFPWTMKASLGIVTTKAECKIRSLILSRNWRGPSLARLIY